MKRFLQKPSSEESPHKIHKVEGEKKEKGKLREEDDGEERHIAGAEKQLVAEVSEPVKFQLKETRGDLFSVPGDVALVHCTSACLAMGKGIALMYDIISILQFNFIFSPSFSIQVHFFTAYFNFNRVRLIFKLDSKTSLAVSRS
jgi:hypothetical protein